MKKTTCSRCRVALRDDGACPRCGASVATAVEPRGDAAAEAPTLLGSGTRAPSGRVEPAGDGGTSEAPTGLATPPGVGPASRGTGRAEPVAREEGPLRVGEAFGARYHIIRMLGQGGMGAVYQAWDEELGVAVALKVVRPEIAANPEAARHLERRFKRELLLARQVTHKNVVRIHDLGEIDGVKYITMPYVDGVDLASIQKENKNGLPVEQVLAIARGIVAGLLAAHEAGVVHRDLKPANVMVEEETGEALIMDFGIARSATDEAEGEAGKRGRLRASPFLAGQTMAGTVVGTLEYMAPEQARGQKVDHRADLYAFGLILYDLLAGGARAGRPTSAVRELRQRMAKPPPSLAESRPDLPPSFERIVARCIEPDPDARYATTAELAADLDRLDEHGNPKPLPRRFSRAFVATASAAVLAALVGTWHLARTRVPPEPPPPLSVLVADFDNATGDAVFEGSVEQALTVALEGAPFVSAYPRTEAQRLAAALQRDGRLDADGAQLVARREGIKVVLAGAIAPERSGYAVSVRALDPALDDPDAEPLAAYSVRARTKEEVLASIAELASRLRDTLGDTTPESARRVAAETVTASSLEALRAYTRAQELAAANRYQEALAAYEKTVAIDPGFGRAYAGMGVIYTIFKDEARAKTAYESALRLVDRMSEREKYRTLGTYYMSIARNYEKAIENYEKLVELFPADDVGHGNLGLAYLYTGNVPRAIEEVRKVLDLYPNQWADRYNYAMYSMYAGDFATALAEGSRLVDEVPSFEYAFLPVVLSTLAEGRFDDALEVYDRLEATGPTGASLARFGRADLEMVRGRYDVAATLLEDAIAAEAEAASPGVRARNRIAAAEAALALGEADRAVVLAREASAQSAHESVLFPAAQIFLAAGAVADAEAIASTLDNMLQTHTMAYARLIDAELLARNGRYGTAVETFRDSIERRDTWFARFLLGKLYVETGHYPEAMAELELCIQRRGEVTDVFFYDTPTLRYLPPAYYWLGRAQEALGAAGARASYEAYLAFRGGSSPPDPLAADARTRLE